MFVMPRLASSHATTRLLQTLSAAIGHESAKQELKWMQQTLLSPPPGPASAMPDLAKMVARRTQGEPLQYILGTQPFGPLHIRCRAPVLIPRPETEDWALRVSSALAPSPAEPVRVLDLCTGTGCIPLLLCAAWPPGSARALGVDISTDALALARENAAAHGIPTQPSASGEANANVLSLLQGDVRRPAALAQRLPFARFDVLTANPPYIPRDEYAALPRSVRGFEDTRALLGDPPGAPERGGLTFYHAIAELIARRGVLGERALVALEVGEGQARAVEDIVRHTGVVRETEIWRDPWGKERVVIGRT